MSQALPLLPSHSAHPPTTHRLLLIDVLRLSEPFFKQKNPSPQIMIFPSQLKVLSLNNCGCKPEKDKIDGWHHLIHVVHTHSHIHCFHAYKHKMYDGRLICEIPGVDRH